MKVRWVRRSSPGHRRYVLMAEDGQWLATVDNPWYADGMPVRNWRWTVLQGLPWQGMSDWLWRSKAEAETYLAISKEA